tara:strand:- start:68 stop:712 length:645 start_codon:yes stop_codon:yes gene_type:complete
MRYNVAFLLDKKNNWFEKYLRNYKFKLKSKYRFFISKNYKNIKNKEIVFILSFMKILPVSFLKRNKLNLVVHSSNLPKDRGFAPLTYQVLRNQNKFYTSLIEADKKVDSGKIFFKNKFKLDGTELNNEIRFKQSEEILKIIKKFLIKYPKVKSYNQMGKATYNKRRVPSDSELNIYKNIKSQFNLLRVNDNEKYPSFFKYKGKKYILKIFKEKR